MRLPATRARIGEFWNIRRQKVNWPTVIFADVNERLGLSAFGAFDDPKHMLRHNAANLYA
jgi:hypothetical protein